MQELHMWEGKMQTSTSQTVVSHEYGVENMKVVQNLKTVPVKSSTNENWNLEYYQKKKKIKKFKPISMHWLKVQIRFSVSLLSEEILGTKGHEKKLDLFQWLKLLGNLWSCIYFEQLQIN